MIGKWVFMVFSLIFGLAVLYTESDYLDAQHYIRHFQGETYLALNWAAAATSQEGNIADPVETEAIFDKAMEQIDHGELVGNTMTPNPGSWLRGPVTIDSVRYVPKGQPLNDGVAAWRNIMGVVVTSPSWNIDWPVIGERPLMTAKFDVFAAIPN